MSIPRGAYTSIYIPVYVQPYAGRVDLRAHHALANGPLVSRVSQRGAKVAKARAHEEDAPEDVQVLKLVWRVEEAELPQPLDRSLDMDPCICMPGCLVAIVLSIVVGWGGG